MNYRKGIKTERSGIIRAINNIKPHTVSEKMRKKIIAKDPDPVGVQIARLKRRLARERIDTEHGSRGNSVLVSSQSTRNLAVPTLTSPRERSEGRREFLEGCKQYLSKSYFQ